MTTKQLAKDQLWAAKRRIDRIIRNILSKYQIEDESLIGKDYPGWSDEDYEAYIYLSVIKEHISPAIIYFETEGKG